MSGLSVQSLCAGYGRQNIIENVSFRLEEGCLMGVIGANGSGKSTLLKALCGILPHGGTCMLEGNELECLSARQMARLVSYIPQRSGISIDISALDVVLMGYNPRLGLLEQPSPKMIAEAKVALAQVGLAGREDTNYLHLSEGQKQLCILARTLVSGSRLLLLDEPESALDFHFRYRMLELLRSSLAENRRSALVALHDPALALNFCDELLLLSGGGISAVIRPKTDALAAMEEALGVVYGNVSLQRCCNRSGQSCLVMLNEDGR